MFLMLCVAGHMTIFLTRTHGPFWSIRPARVLVVAVFGAQALAILLAVYGVLMAPLGWGLALFVWGYAMGWFLVTDRLKLLAYRFIDPPKGKLESTKVKPSSDLTPQVASRAYELYEREGRKEGHANQDWLEAEREVRNENLPG